MQNFLAASSSKSHFENFSRKNDRNAKEHLPFSISLCETKVLTVKIPLKSRCRLLSSTTCWSIEIRDPLHRYCADALWCWNRMHSITHNFYWSLNVLLSAWIGFFIRWFMTRPINVKANGICWWCPAVEPNKGSTRLKTKLNHKPPVAISAECKINFLFLRKRCSSWLLRNYPEIIIFHLPKRFLKSHPSSHMLHTFSSVQQCFDRICTWWMGEIAIGSEKGQMFIE